MLTHVCYCNIILEVGCIVYQFYHIQFTLIRLIHKLECFFGINGHVALDKNPGPGNDTLLLQLILGDLLSACPHRQFHILPGLLYSRAALSNSYPNACMSRWEAVCTIFMMVFGII